MIHNPSNLHFLLNWYFLADNLEVRVDIYRFFQRLIDIQLFSSHIYDEIFFQHRVELFLKEHVLLHLNFLLESVQGVPFEI